MDHNAQELSGGPQVLQFGVLRQCLHYRVNLSSILAGKRDIIHKHRHQYPQVISEEDVEAMVRLDMMIEAQR